MSDVRVVKVNGLKKGNFVMINGDPCRVTDVQISKTGKHGHSKARITAVGLFDDKKRVIVKPGDSTIEAPNIVKGNAQVISLREESKTVDNEVVVKHFANVMDLESFETFEVEVPEELVGKVVEGCQVLYWEVTGVRIIQRVL